MGWHTAAIGPNPKKLCWWCVQGMHDSQHTAAGCLRTIDKPPRDFVCACEEKGKSGRGGRVFAYRTPLQ